MATEGTLSIGRDTRIQSNDVFNKGEECWTYDFLMATHNMTTGWAPEVSPYFEMLRIRRIEEAIARRYSEQQMRTPVHFSIGQEAPAVGVSMHLTLTDQAMSAHRNHAHYLAKGGSLKRMISELYGRSTGCCKGRGGSQHLIDTSVGFAGAAPILGSTISIATGIAFQLANFHPRRVAVAFFGDAACEEGVFHESLSFASLHSLPIIFVCENNLYSVHSPVAARQPDRPIAELAIGHRVPSFEGDGNDVEEVSAMASIAVARARVGDGPSFLVFNTYRTVGHVGPEADLNLGYRTQDELDYWATKDPLVREMRRLDFPNDVWHELEDRMESSISSEIESAFQFALDSPYPDVTDTGLDVVPS